MASEHKESYQNPESVKAEVIDETTRLVRKANDVKEESISKGESCLGKYGLAGILITVVLVIIALCTFFAGGSNELKTVKPGTRLHFASAKYGLYLRAQGTSMAITEQIPWDHGSTFEVVSGSSPTCFHLRTMAGKFFRANVDSKRVMVDGQSSDEGTMFEAVIPKGVMGKTLKDVGELKVCGEELWLSVEEVATNAVGEDQPSSELILTLATTTSQFKMLRTIETFSSQANAFIFEEVPPIKGVNLGGWFIPEIWMNPQFSNYTGLGWAGSLCNVANYSMSLADENIKAHLADWLHEEDFAEMAKDGFNSVRLPMGYWNVMEDPYHIFVPTDFTISLQYIDWTFDMAAKYGLTVLLDLHGAPGSQNGVDHSGCSRGADWLENPDNIELTYKTIEIMAKRYAHHPALMGFEIANEPALKYCEGGIDEIRKVYEKSYGIIRRHSKTCKVVFNELYEQCYHSWAGQLVEPHYYNVIMDVHLYNWQEPYTQEEPAQHIADAQGWSSTIDQVAADHPVIVGEWCFSTGTYVQVLQPFVDACVESFTRSSGWYIWSWKVERNIHFDEWDVQYQYSLPDGMRAT